MKRQGKYTKKPTVRARARYAYGGRFGWWKRLSWKRRFLVIALPVLGLAILIPLLTYAYYAQDISDPERLMNRTQTGVILMDKDGQEFYRSGTAENRSLVPLAQISDTMEHAVLASEDKDFYQHGGVSVKSLAAALYANVLNKDATAYGGSTLTQQLVKNTLLSSNKSILRKYQELFMSIAVERRYSKDEILDMYLNSVYFGENAFGIQDAAKVYFNKSPADLTLAESTMLVGLLPAPSAYSPISGDALKAKQRQTYVLKRLVEDGYATTADSAGATAEQLTYAPAQVVESHAPHFAQMVIAELNKKYGEEAVIRSGFRVKTSLDLDWQKQAESIVSAQTAINARGKGDSAALVAIDPKSGEIRALVGSPDYDNTEFGKINFATNARQPGSSFKPIYFTKALEQKLITPATIIADVATDFGGGYQPHNYDYRFRGDITVRNALSQSLNIPAVKVMQKVGVGNALSTARSLGLTTLGTDSSQYGLSLALGAGEVTPLQMTNAYAAFANSGRQYDTTTLVSVNNKFGKNIYTHAPASKRVMSPEATFLISDILSDNTARAPTFGSSLNTSRDTAVKTGSTDDNRDAWTIGYTPTIAVGVWVGNHANEIMNSGGSAMAGPIWRKSIEVFFKDVPDEAFAQPSTVSQVSICRGSEKRAVYSGSNTFKEYFINGYAPSATCNSTNSSQPVITPQPNNTTTNNAADDDTTSGGDDPDDTITPTSPTPTPTPLPTPTTPTPPTTPIVPTPTPTNPTGGTANPFPGGTPVPR